MTDLKPCPFCGCEVEAVDAHYVPWLINTGEYFKIVGNHDEECVFPFLGYDFFFESKEAAIEAWNRRADDDTERTIG